MNIGNKKIHPNDAKEILNELSGNKKPSDEELKRMKKILENASLLQIKKKK